MSGASEEARDIVFNPDKVHEKDGTVQLTKPVKIGKEQQEEGEEEGEEREEEGEGEEREEEQENKVQNKVFGYVEDEGGFKEGEEDEYGTEENEEEAK